MTDADLIIPPPDVRKIIDKMAGFVARVGVQFEDKVIAQERGNPKFAFIQTSNPYHAYYQRQIKQERDSDKMADGEEETKTETKPQAKVEPTDDKESERKSLIDALRTGAATIAPKVEIPAPIEPPAFQFISDIPFLHVDSFDLEVIKLTAQFSAVNGDHFLSGLSKREQSNPQFDFLRPGHPANSYFSSLVRSYTKIARPAHNMISELLDSSSRSILLENILTRVEWERYRLKTERDKEEEEKVEREARSLIDWHSFVIVETISFADDDTLAEPKDLSALHPDSSTSTSTTSNTNPSSSSSSKSSRGNNNNNNNDDMDMDMDMDMETDSSIETIAAPTTNLQVRKDYQPRIFNQSKKIQYQKCPVCSQDIPVDDLDEHVRIELLDPRFSRNVADKRQKTGSNAVLATGMDVVRQLKGMQPHRSDIFDESDPNAVRMSASKDENKDKVIWDGHAGSARGATNTGVSIQDQINAIHEANANAAVKDSGVGPAPMPTPTPTTATSQQPDPTRTNFPPFAPMAPYPGMVVPPTAVPIGMIPPPGVMRGAPVLPVMGIPVMPGMMYPPTNPDEPPLKKQKLEDITSQLVDEQQWMKSHPLPIPVKIITPDQPNKTGWKLDGAPLSITISVSETVQALKEKISELLNLPPNKQNLKVDGLPFLKDKDTLAFYNINTKKDVHLSVKERGRGRK